jgi:predicted alpha/beta-hydrolase family hydrolase
VNIPANIIVNGKKSSPLWLLLAHGAGAPSDSDFMHHVAESLAKKNVRVGRFEFPYMQKRREDGKRRPPDREPILRAAFAEALEEFSPGRPCFIGGKSMGGRIATMVAADADVEGPEVDIAGVVCLGYPFHPPGRPEKLRVAHLAQLKVPTLILQGERDPFGNAEEYDRFEVTNDRVEVTWLPDGNHDLKPRKASGTTHEQHLTTAAQRIVEWMVGFRSAKVR